LTGHALGAILYDVGESTFTDFELSHMHTKPPTHIPSSVPSTPLLLPTGVPPPRTHYEHTAEAVTGVTDQTPVTTHVVPPAPPQVALCTPTEPQKLDSDAESVLYDEVGNTKKREREEMVEEEHAAPKKTGKGKKTPAGKGKKTKKSVASDEKRAEAAERKDSDFDPNAEKKQQLSKKQKKTHEAEEISQPAPAAEETPVPVPPQPETLKRTETSVVSETIISVNSTPSSSSPEPQKAVSVLPIVPPLESPAIPVATVRDEERKGKGSARGERQREELGR
jgi:hypothetical protein